MSKSILMTAENGQMVFEGLKTATRRMSKKANVGDVLWIREPYWFYGKQIVDGDKLTMTGRAKTKFLDFSNKEIAEEYGIEPQPYLYTPQPKIKRTELGYHKQIGLFMPRNASRTKVIVTAVYEQNLSKMTTTDAIAEGVMSAQIDSECMRTEYMDYETGIYNFLNPLDSFISLWDSINGKIEGRRWTDNPFVWVHEFRLPTERDKAFWLLSENFEKEFFGCVLAGNGDLKGNGIASL